MNLPSAVGETIFKTGGSVVSMGAVSCSALGFFVSLHRPPPPRPRVFRTSCTMSGRLKRAEKREAGKKSASWVQPRLRCQPIRSSPPGDAM